jgi:hypothetical protein
MRMHPAFFFVSVKLSCDPGAQIGLFWVARPTENCFGLTPCALFLADAPCHLARARPNG